MREGEKVREGGRGREGGTEGRETYISVHCKSYTLFSLPSLLVMNCC